MAKNAKQTEDAKEKAKRTAEDKAAKDAKKAADDVQRGKAKTDYGRHIENVEDLASMTETANWQRVHRAMSRQMAAHRDALVDCASKEVIPHQEAIKAIRALFNVAAQPVQDLNEFVRDFVTKMPLFAGDMKKSAEWNAESGRVIWRTR